MKIGLFGGSFNPIHCGHIALAQEILRRSGLDEVWLMVSPQNPLKQQSDLLDDVERIKLARKALEGVEGIKASDFEFHLPKPSYTWNTLEALRSAYPDYLFSLIIGGDNWERFDRWYRADDIRAQYPIIVYPRKEVSPLSPTGDSTDLVCKANEVPSGTVGGGLPLFNVSSTEIRERVRRGESIAGLVPPCILNDVERLYSD